MAGWGLSVLWMGNAFLVCQFQILGPQERVNLGPLPSLHLMQLVMESLKELVPKVVSLVLHEFTNCKMGF
jgi:hypothetical protein